MRIPCVHRASVVNRLLVISLVMLIQATLAQQIVEFTSKIVLKNTTTGNETTIDLQGLSQYQELSTYESNMTLTSKKLVS